MTDVADALQEGYGAVGSSNNVSDALQEGLAHVNQTAPGPAPTRTERVLTGLGDTEYGLGQLVEHTPVLSTVVSGWRQLIQQGLQTAGFGHAAELFNQSDGSLTDQKAAANFDSIVQQREADYQNARTAAGQTGIDWWRLGGEAANPVNYLSAGAPAASVAGRIGQAAVQGAMVNASQPINQANGSYWWDKAKSMAVGAFSGGATAGLVEALMPVLRAGTSIAKRVLGSAAADTTAADSVVNDALRAKGIDPSTVDLNMLSGMRQEVKNALEGGAEDISPEAIVNRAKAESLPVPIRLMKGQATGDPMLYSTEQNLRGITGVGEPLTQRLQEQNAGFIENLDALGAKDAPDTVSTGNILAQKIQKFWDDTDAQKNALYDTVRNSQGQSAFVNAQAAAKQIRETLGSPEELNIWYRMPDEIKQTIADLESGNLPLRVSQLEALDSAWGADARAAANGNVRVAINKARTILGNAEIDDDVGQQALQAYKQASAAHAQQMSLVTEKPLNGKPNPNYQPLVDDVVYGGKTGEIFKSGFMNASPAEAGKNMQFVSGLDPSLQDTVSDTTMGEIKRLALSNASDERGTVSQSVLAGFARDPVKAARLQQLISPEQFATFRNLADTVEVAKRFPVASTVNTSNTGSTVVNAVGSALKSNAVAQVVKRLPLIRGFPEAFEAGTEQAARQTEVNSALNPGVTLSNLMRGTPKEAATNRLLSRLIVPAAALPKSTKKPEQVSDNGNN